MPNHGKPISAASVARFYAMRRNEAQNAAHATYQAATRAYRDSEHTARRALRLMRERQRAAGFASGE